MVSEGELVKKIKELMNYPERIRNIGIVAHVDHGKTTVSDSLLAGAGMLSQEIAGQARALDFLEEEQKRGITIQAAAVSMIHKYENNEYLINLIDTPGHVDFGGEVTRAMRAIDGAIVIVDAVEGVMPQTETVIRQALKEYVKPVLFINKTDRLIKELELEPQEILERIKEIIIDVNKLIRSYAPEEFKDKWTVKVEDGSVAFGSGVDKWALSLPYMKKKGISFKDIYEAYKSNDPNKIKELSNNAQLHVVLLDMVVRHLPSPKEAQKYRIPHIWKGDINSEIGKSLLECNPNGPLMILITKIIVDPQAGELAIGRIYSGTAKQGMQVYLLKSQKEAKLNQLYVAKGPRRLQVEEVKAGNIIGIAGIKGLSVGEVISDNPNVTPFEEIKHIFEPVVTVAVEPANPRDLARLLQVLGWIEKEYYPDVKVEINEKTGEYLIHAQGELHVEWLITKIRKYYGLNIKVSPPIVVYRETVTSRTPEPQEGKSPNKHNKLYVIAEPLEDNLFEAIRKGEIPEGKVRKKDFWKVLEQYGMDREEARKVVDIFNGNIYVEATVGVIHIGEILDMTIQAFEQMAKEGPLAKEPMAKVKIKLVDAILHEDAIHRGPAQIIPAMRQAIKKAFLLAEPTLLEPIQRIRIDARQEYLTNITRLISRKRGKIIETEYKGDYVIILADIPVKELIGFTSELRSAAQGRAAWFRVDQYYQPLPKELFKEVLKEIRKRKGLPEEIEIEEE